MRDPVPNPTSKFFSELFRHLCFSVIPALELEDYPNSEDCGDFAGFVIWPALRDSEACGKLPGFSRR